MGVKDAWSFLKKQFGLEGNPVDPKASSRPVHVDTLSIFRAYILATGYYILKDLFWQRLRASRSKHQDAGILNDEYLEEAWIKRLMTRLNNRLLQHFRQASSVLHIDGAPSVQKAQARSERQEKQGESLNKLQVSLNKVQDLLGQASQTDAVSRSRKDKLVREAHTAQQLWKAARTLDNEMKEMLAEELQDLGWSVCRCDGEADVCIAGQQGPITVATTDGDFLFLGVDTILRQDPENRSSFREFSIQDILETLDIGQEAWTAVGVVTKNDYCKNIPEHAISTNFKALQPISMSGISDPEGILDEYCSRVSKKTKKSYDRSMFQLAYDVFFNHHEDLEENPTASSFFDYTIMDMLTAVENVLQRYRRSRRPPKTVSSTLGMVDAQMTDAQENPSDGSPSDGTQDAMQVDSSDGTQEDAPDNV